MRVMVMWLMTMRMIAKQMASMEMTAVLMGVRAVIVQQTAGCRGQQIGCNGNSRRKPTGEHSYLSKTTNRAATLSLWSLARDPSR
jgi:hypothetical protein